MTGIDALIVALITAGGMFGVWFAAGMPRFWKNGT